MNPLTAINELARMAAESSIDAHGEPVEPQMAWDFMREQIAPEDSHVESLFAHTGENMPRQFTHDYPRHCRIVMESKDVGNSRPNCHLPSTGCRLGLSFVQAKGLPTFGTKTPPEGLETIDGYGKGQGGRTDRDSDERPTN